MKNFLILNNLYNTIKEINEKTFIGLIEVVKGEKEALNRAKILFPLTKAENMIAEECQVNYSS